MHDPTTESLSGSTAPPAAGGPAADLTGRVLGDFQILRRLGQGGMGQVYLAEQRSLKRRVALKILRADLAGDATCLQRFKVEAEAVARATHANIVQVYAIGEADGLHYMALEYVEGRTLREFVEKKGPPDLPLALGVIAQVAAALERAGEMGIIHRDIKPDNILLTRKGEAKVADFGLSRVLADNQPTLHLTQSGVTMGTPLYMSPEQVEGRPVDPRSDLYSFGVTCYFMLAGQPPYRGQNPFEVALQHVTGTPRPLGEIRPDLPPALCALVHKLMARHPEQRYQTAREVLREVDQLRGTTPGAAVGLSGPSLLWASGSAPTGTAPARTRRWLPWAVAASALLALAGGGLLGWDHGGPRPATEPPAAGPLFSSLKEREQFLEAGLDRYASPGDDREKIEWGLKYGIDLGLLYLDNGDLAKAERLFRRLDTPGQGTAYRTLGKLGRAIVLALQDRYRESNLLFREVVPSFWRRGPDSRDERLWFLHLIRTNRNLRRMIARALDHNFDNDPTSFPPELQYLRRPPGALPRGPGPG